MARSQRNAVASTTAAVLIRFVPDIRPPVAGSESIQ
jgi:hypothetical protein